MLELIEHNNLSALLLFISIRAAIILVCWVFVVFGNVIDFWSGTSTAKAVGEKLDTHGFRRTIVKIGDYVKVMLFFLMFDLLGMLLPFYNLPYGTMLVTVAILIIEGLSVVENHKRKKAHAAHVPEVIKKIVQASTLEQGLAILNQIKQEVTT